MVRLDRHYTAERINEIINHPSIYASVRGHHTDPLDMSAIASNPEHVCLVGEHGCVLFIRHQPGIYEFHTSVLPEGRGEWMVEGSRTAFSHMFLNTDAFELLTKCPYGNVAAKAGAKVVGCSLRFTTRAIWPLGKSLVPIDVYSIILQEWVKHANNLTESGKWFHETLDLEYTTLGKDLSVHEEDETHDRYVGAAVEMIRGGQVAKAISFYNRWAVMSDYKKISLISAKPLIISIDEALIEIEQDKFKVV